MCYSIQSILILFLLFNARALTAQELNYQLTDKNGNEKLLGVINEEGLMKSPFNTWYTIGFTAYEVDKAMIQSIKDELNSYSIKVFMGTWCGDSRREIPKFYKVLKAAGFPEEKLITVAVDYIKPNYKKSPGGEEKGMNIIRVPTFIFYKNGKEVNRIIESPITSFEADIAAIVNGNNYVPNYSNIPVLPLD